MKKFLIIAAACLLVSGTAIAQHEHHESKNEAAKALHTAHEKMMKNMHIESTGNIDRDYVIMMIPHHQGAIDMAKAQLQYGTDPEIRKLSEEIIAAQEKEIAMMKAWLEKH